MNLKKLPQKLPGFSLLEILLYLSIMSIVVTVSSALFNVLIEGRLRNQVQVEINQQGNAIVDTFATTLRNSESITNITADSITFEGYDDELNPIVLDETDGTITISYAGGAATPLHSDDVTISNLTFTDVSNALTTGSVKISFDMGYNSTSQRAAFQTVETFSTTATLRKATNTGSGSGGFSLNNWSYRKTITIDNTLVSGAIDLENFPFYFYLESDADLADEALANGYDIIFTTNTGTVLDFELDQFNEATGEIGAWIEIPILDVDADTEIYVYYGNAAAINLENPTGVWGGDYILVQHMDEDPTGIAPQFMDSTVNENDGTSGGSMTAGDLVEGISENSIDFDGVDDSINSGNDSSLDIVDDSFSIGAWIRPGAATATSIFNKPHAATHTSPYFKYALYYDGGSNPRQIQFRIDDTYIRSGGTHLCNQDVWCHAVGVYDGSQMHVFVNGVLAASTAKTGDVQVSTENLITGANVSGGERFIGRIDEIRINNTALSSGWITTEYNNLSNLAGFYDVSTEFSTANWYDENWLHRKSVSFSSSMVSGSSDLTNFPVLVKVSGDTDLSSNALANGDDILFTASDGTTKLNHEIESYSAGNLIAWVNIPSLSASLDTEILMYFGNAAAAPQENAGDTWPIDYVIVSHLNETVTNDVYGLLDSSGQGNHGAPKLFNGSGSSATGVTGLFDKAISTDGADDYVVIDDSASLDFGSGGFTVSSWVNTTQDCSGTRVYSSRYSPSTSFWLGCITSGNAAFNVRDSNGNSATVNHTGDVINDGNWHYLVGTHNGNQLSIYVDGVSVQGTGSYTGNYDANTNWQFAKHTTSAPGYWAAATLDEMRVSNIVKDSDWINTEYNNLSDPATYTTFGSLQSISGGGEGGSGDWYNAAWSYRKSITVSNSIVSGSSDLTDFPVLVEINSDSDLSANALANGHDILFTASDGLTKLSHEIESYSSGSLLAWVKLPTLSASANTEIFIYFGNAGASNQQDIENAWSNNFLMVQKMNTDPGGTAPQMIDSTSNNYDGTSSGTMDSSDLVAGHIGGGIQFDGTDDLVSIPTNYGLTATSEVTITTWVYLDTTSKKGAFFKIGTNNGYGFGVGGSNLGNNGNDLIAIYEYVRWIDTNTTIGTGNHMVTMQVNSSGVPSFYLDGNLVGSYAGSNASNPAAASSIGGYSLSSRYSSARIDHVTLSSGLRSADWIATEYNNQSDADSNITVGSLETN